MLTAKKVLAASRVYTEETAIGMGALKGANCTIKSITKTGDLNTVIFEWTDTEGGKHENTMLVYDGAPGQDGDDGFSPTITVKTATSSEYVLTITDKNGSYDTPNLKGGGGGGGGASSLSDLDDIALSSLANGDVLVYDSTAGKWKNVQLDIPTQLSDLSDIDLASLADADILKYDFASQKWANSKLDYSELTGTPTLGTAAAKDSTNAVTQGSSELLESGGAYTALDGKVDKVTGKGLSTNDFTDAEKQKLDNMELDDLADVDMTGITDGQVLAWDDANSKMVPADQTGTEYTAGMGVDISAQNEISTEFIMFPGTKAEWDQLPVSEKIKYTHTAWNDSQSGIVDNLPTQNSDNLVKSGGVWTGLDAKADKTALTDYQTKDLATPITVDGTSQTTVEGALGAINTLAAGNNTDKADKVSSATNGDFAGLDASGNLTDSGKKASDFATAQGLADEAATRSYMGAKNYLQILASGTTTTDGITFVVNDDGTITVSTDENGATADTNFYLNPASQIWVDPDYPIGDYILSGCPAGGSAGTYRLALSRQGASSVFDTGTGANFTHASEVKTLALIQIGTGTVLTTPIVFKPMIRLASDTDSTYQPYAKTNKQLTDDSVDWYSNGIIGAKNLIPFPYPKESDTVLGIDFTANSNGEVIASGTSTGIAVYDVVNTELYGWNVPREGTYILSDGLSDADYEYAYTAVTFMYNDGTIEYNVGDTSIGRTVITIPSNLKNFYVGCCIRIDKTVSNIKFKPMLRMIEDSDETFRLYAKTNRELTVDKAELTQISNPNLLDNPWFTVNQRGFSSKNDNGFTVDRWQILQAAGTVSLSNGAITIDPTVSGTTFLWGQTIENAHSKLAGKSVTLSVMLSDGTIKSKSFDYPTNSPSNRMINNVYLGSTHYFELYEYSSGHARVGYFNNSGVIPSAPLTIKAVKLELGNVSTLAMDTAPNFAQELLKCQYYFVNVFLHKKNYAGPFFAEGNANQLYFAVNLPVPMRGTPSIELDSENIYVIGNNAHATVTTYTAGVTTIDNNVLKAVLSSLDATEITDVNDHLYALNFFDSSTKKFWLSADI